MQKTKNNPICLSIFCPDGMFSDWCQLGLFPEKSPYIRTKSNAFVFVIDPFCSIEAKSKSTNNRVISMLTNDLPYIGDSHYKYQSGTYNHLGQSGYTILITVHSLTRYSGTTLNFLWLMRHL